MPERRNGKHRAKHAEGADMPHARHHPVRRHRAQCRAHKKSRIERADGGVAHPHLRQLHPRRVEKQAETGKEEKYREKEGVEFVGEVGHDG